MRVTFDMCASYAASLGAAFSTASLVVADIAWVGWLCDATEARLVATDAKLAFLQRAYFIERESIQRVDMPQINIPVLSRNLAPGRNRTPSHRVSEAIKSMEGRSVYEEAA